MTRDEAVTRALLYYNEPTTSNAVATADWQNFCQAIYDELASECLAIGVTYTCNAVDGQRTYMMPTYMIGIRDRGVETATSGMLNGPVSPAILRSRDMNWDTTEGIPTDWYLEEAPITSGSDTNWGIGFYRVFASNGTDEITVRGWRTAPTLSSSTVFRLPFDHHETVPWGMCKLAAVRDMERGLGNNMVLAYFSGEYEKRKRNLKARMSKLAGKVWVVGGESQPWNIDGLAAGYFNVQVTSS